mmetsp:Transcript_60584/g.192319  ORF Transcript_60584/g.192319 Transcript_60584/m.192319 type:complete len:242 (+) Transcript_60584:1053-1778(+)
MRSKLCGRRALHRTRQSVRRVLPHGHRVRIQDPPGPRPRWLHGGLRGHVHAAAGVLRHEPHRRCREEGRQGARGRQDRPLRRGAVLPAHSDRGRQKGHENYGGGGLRARPRHLQGGERRRGGGHGQRLPLRPWLERLLPQHAPRQRPRRAPRGGHVVHQRLRHDVHVPVPTLWGRQGERLRPLRWRGRPAWLLRAQGRVRRRAPSAPRHPHPPPAPVPHRGHWVRVCELAREDVLWALRGG